MKITILSHNNDGVDNSAKKLVQSVIDNSDFDANVLDFRKILWERENHYTEVGEIVIPRVTRMGKATTIMIVKELERMGKFIFPDTLLRDLNLGNKNYQQSLISSANIMNCIETFTIVYSGDVKKLVDSGKLNFPFIFKPNSSSEGRGIFVVNSLEEWGKLVIDMKVPDGKYFNFCIQNFIPNNHDYRVYVIGGKTAAAMKRFRTTGYLNNFSQGGSVEGIVLNSEIGKTISELAEKVCKAANIDVAGIDILEDLNGKLYFMEINTSAQWEGLEIATGIDIGKIYLEECLKQYEIWKSKR